MKHFGGEDTELWNRRKIDASCSAALHYENLFMSVRTTLSLSLDPEKELSSNVSFIGALSQA